ncbi:MAG: SAM-dependent methyltransferase, partial [Kutzneria sp.]|nr:SAM-dependent methyltransferase [Kutzneria sp.]
MLDRPSWAPKHIDLDKPSSARIYNYLLGGACNAASDRAVARELLAITPEIRDMARVNRAFLRRVVPFLVHSGVRQFLDIGSGIPNVGNVHDVAQQLDPECRVVYVDNDPIAIAHSELLIQGNERAGTVTADFRDPDSILRSPT